MSTLAPERQLSPCLLEAVFEIVDRSLVELVFELVCEACDTHARALARACTHSHTPGPKGGGFFESILQLVREGDVRDLHTLHN